MPPPPPENDRPSSPILLSREDKPSGFFLRLQVPQNLVFFEGHFPQVAVVAGVVLVRWVVAAIREYAGHEVRIRAMEAVKFHKLLFPGQICELEVTYLAGKRKWSYLMVRDGQKIASGRLVEAA